MSQTAFNYEQAKIDARADNPWVRRKLAAHPSAPSEILSRLAKDPAVDVRRAVARNASTPVPANATLARDRDYGVRCAVARKVVGEGLADDQRRSLWRVCFTILETLACDRMLRVRRILAEAFMHPPDAPANIVRILARDKKREVAAPVLRNSPVLSDVDIIDIIDTNPPDWVQTAIATRENVTPAVADALVRSGSEKVITAMLANPHVEIGEQTMERIVDHAPTVPEWHEHLVKRPALTGNIILRLARFVAVPLLAILKTRTEGGAAGAAALDRVASARGTARAGSAGVRPDTQAPAHTPAAQAPAHTPAAQARVLHAGGRLNDEVVTAALDGADHDFVIAALALRSKFSVDKVRRIVSAKSPRSMTALAWKAGFTARFAMELQKRLGHIPPSSILNARDGIDFALTKGQMAEQLLMFTD